MSRNFELYLNDILTAIANVEKYTAGITFDQFSSESMRQDSVLYNLMIIGEAVKNVPEELRKKSPDVEWRNIGRFRDKLVHHYFGIKPRIVWEIVMNDLPPLRTHVEKLLEELKEQNNGEE